MLYVVLRIVERKTESISEVPAIKNSYQLWLAGGNTIE